MAEEQDINALLDELKGKSPIIKLSKIAESSYALDSKDFKADRKSEDTIIGKLNDLQAATELVAEEASKIRIRSTESAVRVAELPEKVESNNSAIAGDALMYLEHLEANSFDLVSLADKTLKSVDMIWDLLVGNAKKDELKEDQKFPVAKPQKEDKGPLPEEEGGFFSKLLTWLSAPFILGSKILKKGVLKIADWLLTPFKSIGKFAKNAVVKIIGMVEQKAAAFFKPVLGFFEALVKKFPMLGKLGKAAGFIAKGFGKFIQPILSIIDFFTGFSDAEDIVGKAKDKLTFFEKVFAGLSEVFSGLTFGLIDAKKFYEWIFSEKGIFGKIKSFANSLYELLPQGIKRMFSSVWDFMSGVLRESLTTVNIPFKAMGIDMVGLVQKVMSYVSDFIGNMIKESVSGSILGKVGSFGKDLLTGTVDKVKGLWSGDESESSIEARDIKGNNFANARANATAQALPKIIETPATAMKKKKEEAIAAKATASGTTVINNSSSNNISAGEAKKPTTLDLDIQLQLMGT